MKSADNLAAIEAGDSPSPFPRQALGLRWSRLAHVVLLAALLVVVVACGGTSDGDATATGDPAADTTIPESPPGMTATPTVVPAVPTPTSPPAISIPQPENASVAFQEVASGFTQPTLLTHAGDGTGTLYVTEKPGTIYTLDGELFMDLTDRVINTGMGGNERELGLLGLAFHPEFESNRLLYVHYNDLAGNTVISRFSADQQGNGDPSSEEILIQIEQPEDHFNGGTILFGPDGYLYIAMGAGGGRPEDLANSQNLGNLLGKILRIDVNSGDPYAIPLDNPYLDVPGAQPEIWAYGLRNPWRISFDRATGDIYIAEPGQFAFEWVHFQAAGPNGAPEGGINYGWPVYEGFHCFEATECQPPPDYQPPIFEYPRGQDGGCVIIGGAVYRGQAIPALQGGYLYSDFCSSIVSMAWRDAAGQWQTATMTDLDGLVSSFGEDEAGEMYVLDISQGIIYKIVPT